MQQVESIFDRQVFILTKSGSPVEDGWVKWRSCFGRDDVPRAGMAYLGPGWRSGGHRWDFLGWKG